MDTNSKSLFSLILFSIVNIGICSAQHVLEKEYVHMRANDTIVKQEVAYKYPGRSGTDVFWNFSGLQAKKAPYRVCYTGNDTLVFANEHLTSYSYELTSGDSLLLSGYRNRTTYFNAVRRGVEFHYPFYYQDSLESLYYGEGKYSDKLAFTSQGRVKVKADAWGTMLLPGNDTLKNVMRILYKDLNRGIVNIDYNILNLPNCITFENGSDIRYKYDADGVKYRADYTTVFNEVLVPIGFTSSSNSGSLSIQHHTDYCDNLIYEDNVLKKIRIDGGYINYDSSTNNGEYCYYIQDHIGNNRVVLSETRGVIQYADYYPFGIPFAEIPIEEDNFLHAGKELEKMHGLYWYDNGKRWYDPILCRFTTMDPLCEQYYDKNPYSYCGDNPMRYGDVNGLNIYLFGENGAYQSKINVESTNRIAVYTKEKLESGEEYDSYQFYDLADPEEDGKDIEDGEINTLVFVSDKDIQGMLNEQGAYESGKFNFAMESQGGGNFDYSFSTLPKKYPQANFNGKNSNSLFLPEGDSMAHNYMNFGNYLWAATGYVVGFSYAELQIGAHLNSKFNSSRNGYESQWDSPDDQRSIIKGAYHAYKFNYRKSRK